MAFRFAGVAFTTLLTVLVAAACGSAPPKPVSDAPPLDEAPEAQSSEWLYATKGIGSTDPKVECPHVLRAIKDESKCNGEACLFASRLSDDWLNRCKKAAPDSYAEVSALAREYATRKDGARVPCMRDIEDILRNGCGDDPNCADVAQAWTTRCADQTGSPLMLRILETRVMQAQGGPVKLDKRGCKGLGGDILTAGNCAQKFACEDAIAGVETYRKRCLPAGTLPAFEEGLAELSIRLGAGQKPGPLPIKADSSTLDPYLFAVTLADGSGIVALTCGDRAKDVGEYLELRSACSGGEVVVVQRQPGRARSTLRVGRFAHSSDEAFRQNYPSLVVQGEVAQRAAAGLARLATALGAVVEKTPARGKYDPEAGELLIEALSKEAFALRSASDRSALAQRDDELVPLFKSLARAKIDAAKSIFEPLKYAAFHRRALKRPLADLGSDGTISAGAMNAAAPLDLAQALPKAVAAYKAELGVFAERVQKKPLSDKYRAELEADYSEAVAACVAAQGKVRESEGAIVECGFTACSAQELGELGKQLSNARIDGTVSHLKVLLAADSLDAPPTSDQAARCVEPWW